MHAEDSDVTVILELQLKNISSLLRACPPLRVLQVKSYLERQWTKILAGRFTVQDFVFAKEVRLGTYT